MMSKSFVIHDYDVVQIPPQQKFNPQIQHWRDGLIVRSPNWLGDAIMSLPALSVLKKQIPQTCGLFVISPPGLYDFYKSLPMVDAIVRLENPHRNWQWHEVKEVQALRPGMALLFNNSPRDAIFLRLARIPKLFGAAARGRSILLTKAFQIPKIKKNGFNHLQHSAKYLSMAYAIGGEKWDGVLPDFIPSPIHESTADSSFLSALSSDHLLIIAPGAAYGEAKRWPAASYAIIAQKWIAQGGYIAAIGTQKEVLAATEILDQLPQERCYNLTGKTQLHELIHLFKHAKGCVANDSGAMHFAAAVGVPVVAIFGSTDPTATAPIGSKSILLQVKQPCAPCFQRICSLGHYQCLHAVTPEMVWDAIQQNIQN